MGNSELSIDVKQISQELRIRPEIYVKIAISFANSLADKLSALNNAIVTNDTDQMRRILHEIKGTSSNLRLTNILGPEDIMHIAVKSREPTENLTKYYHVLKQESERLKKWAQQISQNTSGPNQ